MEARRSQFEALVLAYAPDLYRYAVWLGNRTEAAEDLVQETFMRAWRALDTLHDARAARGWLVTILRREHARQFERRRPESPGLAELDPERIAGFSQAPSADVLAVRRALASLSVQYREPLLLQVLGGYSCEEIGDILGLKPGAVMTRLSRARLKLRRCLEGAGRQPMKMRGPR